LGDKGAPFFSNVKSGKEIDTRFSSRTSKTSVQPC